MEEILAKRDLRGGRRTGGPYHPTTCHSTVSPDRLARPLRSGAVTNSVLEATGAELTAKQLHDLLRLRVDIFVVEQQCPYHEIDGRDLLASTRHLWLADAAGVTSSVRVLADLAGFRIGRVATRTDQRGQGLAALLIGSALDRIGGQTTVLDAQSHLRGFYEQFGYLVTGAEFVEDGIPHLPMLRPPALRPAEA